LLIFDWLEERIELQSIADDILSKFVPAHVNIFYCFGGIVLTSFIYQAASGFSLTIYYRPTVLEAFSSVDYLVRTVNLGWLIRSIHRWSSGLMVLVLILHITRVYLTGGFKKPRELIWISGVILSLLTVSFGVTGYSLPWDQIGFWAAKIVTAVPEAIDDIVDGLGFAVVLLLRGGFSLSQATLTRFYSAHTLLLPILTLAGLLVHFLLLRKQVISGFL
jgi:cytochrome b6